MDRCLIGTLRTEPHKISNLFDRELEARARDFWFLFGTNSLLLYGLWHVGRSHVQRRASLRLEGSQQKVPLIHES